MDVYENEDGSMTIDWNPLDEFESQFNTWTNDDFIEAIKKALTDFEAFEESQEDPFSPEE
jgi:hypothetical protein